MRANRLSILGTGGFTLPTISNDGLMRFLGSPKDSAWLIQKTGIERHSLNFDCRTGKKLTSEHSLDYAERAARQAMAQADVSADRIDHICYATCTPANIHFDSDVIELHRRLGLRRDAVIDQKNGGCAALAKVFDLARVYASECPKERDFYTLIIAANDVAAFIDRTRYRSDRTPLDDAWLSPLIFADGAAALLLGPGDGLALTHTAIAVDGNHPLVTYRGGGAAMPTEEATLDAHAYVMDARDVARQFLPAMERVLTGLFKNQGLAINDIGRWYIHQANLRFLEAFATRYGIPMERIPHNVDRFGNTVSASTLLLLDDDVRSGRFPNEPVMFLFVGAGMMEGGVLFR